MKPWIPLVMLLVLQLRASPQTVPGSSIALSNPRYVPVYSSTGPDSSVRLPMHFGHAAILEDQAREKLENAQVTAVDLVYTGYPAGKSFIDLNRRRMEQLKERYPSLFGNKSIQWNLIRQTDCVTRQEALQLYHGFVIHYRPRQSEAHMRSEIAWLDEILGPDSLEKPAKKLIPLPRKKDSVLMEETFIAGYDPISPDSSHPYKKIPRYQAIREGWLDPEEAKNYKQYDTILVYRKQYYETFEPLLPDSTVLRVLDRNRWKNMLIVADVTGSMSPYTAQLLLWLRLNSEDSVLKDLVVFNDGDMTPDKDKVPGHTGGIYYTRSSRFRDLRALVYKAMENGNGGDAPENNVEALLRGVDICPACSNIVLIADNWAPVKDLSLITQFHKPVKIIVCGADMGVNTDYLNIARSTGGSIHTMEDDLFDLARLREGEEIHLNGKTYVLKKGRFEEVYMKDEHLL